ncbi:ComF family protein [Janibacter alittae]|uniref:Phosphoribosyltransferase family protein n=1 Tax=Janibacter alittae TaxID=3115209 RepID=A0ABZ2MEQ0_9MICO
MGLGSVLAAAGDLVLPDSCAGCGRPGVTVCTGCRAQLCDLALPVLGPLAPYPVPAGWPGCYATLRYAGVAASLARAFKDEDRRDLVDVLGRLLADAVRRAVPQGGSGDSGGPALVVPVPSSPAAIRRRGDRPMLLLARRAARLLGSDVAVEAGLDLGRGTADQAGLDRAARLANLDGAMTTRRPHRIRGRHVVLVDDVLTSGATLTEGRRALLEAGASRVDLAVAMVTPHRSPTSALPFRPGPD